MSLPSDSATAVSDELLRNVPDRAAQVSTQDLNEDLTKITWEERRNKPLTEVCDYKEGVQKTVNFDANANHGLSAEAVTFMSLMQKVLLQDVVNLHQICQDLSNLPN